MFSLTPASMVTIPPDAVKLESVVVFGAGAALSLIPLRLRCGPFWLMVWRLLVGLLNGQIGLQIIGKNLCT